MSSLVRPPAPIWPVRLSQGEKEIGTETKITDSTLGIDILSHTLLHLLILLFISATILFGF